MANHLLQALHGLHDIAGHGWRCRLAGPNAVQRMLQNIFQPVRHTANARQADDVTAAFEGVGAALRLQHVFLGAGSVSPAGNRLFELLQLLRSF